MTTWKNAGELLADVRAARDRLVSGETAVEAAHAEAPTAQRTLRTWQQRRCS